VAPFLLLAIAFVVPLLDVRRPLRLAHLDLAVLVVAPLVFVRFMDQSAGSLRTAVVWTTIGLAYLFVRLSILAFRPRPSYQPLLARAPVSVVTLAAGSLLFLELAFPLYDYRPVIDVGYSSVAGAEHILEGRDVYGATYVHPELRPDTYGPLTYLAYVPFAYLFSDPAHAARVAAAAFHVLTVVALFFLGRRLARGRSGTRLGVAYAYAWCAYPPAFFVTVYAYNDMLVALCLVGAMLAAAPFARGGVLGLGAAAKFVPALTVPLFAAPGGAASRRTLLIYGAAFAAMVAAAVVLLLPDGGVAEFYHRTLGWQLDRASVSSVWGQFGSLGWLQQVTRSLAVVVALGAAFVPRRRSPVQVAALAGAVIALFELSLTHLLPSYVVWFAPLAIVAMLGAPAKREAP
jgi:hypothetical protein